MIPGDGVEPGRGALRPGRFAPSQVRGRGVGRWLTAVVAGVVLAGATTACTPGGPARYPSATVLSRVAASVLDTMNGRGVPVASDRITCHRPVTSRDLVCEGTTADEPTRDVTARFAPTGTGAARSCPGTLTILLDTMTFTRQEVDPCR